MLAREPAIDRARADIEEGRLWKARDRLSGYLAMRPADQRALSLLGEVFFRMGDHPAAGRFWFLTTRSGPEVDIALAALHERYPNAQSLGRAIPARAPTGAFPPEVQLRLLDGELRDHLNPQTRVPYTKGHKVPFWRGGSVDPLAPGLAGRLAGALARATAAVVAIGGWIAGTIWTLRTSEGWVVLPIAVAIVVALLALRIESKQQERRLAALRKRLAGESDRSAR